MSRLKRITLLSTAAIYLALLAQSADAQALVNSFQVATGNWSVPSNWSLGTVPNIANDDIALVGGGSSTSAVATIDSAITDSPGSIQLGSAAANSGTLQILSGGSIALTPTGTGGDGAVTVGVAGTGTLTMDRGTSLTALGLSLGGTAASSIRLGSTTGSGSAQVVLSGDANLSRSMRIIGPNVDFTAANLNLTGTLIEQITGATHSALKATDNASLGGTLSFEVDPSVTPALGTTWTLINARQVAGAFGTVNLSAAPPLPLGQVYNLRTQAGGLGSQVQLAVEQRLVLNVDRATHAVSISNPVTGGVDIDGYSVRSAALGALNPANFTPIGGSWQTANATTSRINQLIPSGSSTITTGSTTALGNIFAPPTPAAFGTSTEDLSFEYTQPDGSIRTGVVNYTGTTGINNLVLRVDPVTGAAQLRNTSLFSENIDAYTISSRLGSLDKGQWSSLADQGAAGGNWQEANISASRLSELKAAGTTTLASGQFYNIGNPFNEVLGKKDLVFQYLLQGESAARTGVIVYETISAALAGDYDGNGTVNAADYVLWRKNPSAFGGSGGYTTWRANFGSTGGSGSGLGVQAVPEPNSCALIVLALGVVFPIALSRRSMRLHHAPCLVVRN